jgi:hypothetical protein
VQGEAEGLTPSSALYEEIIKDLCNRGQLDEALSRLLQMRVGAVGWVGGDL